MVFMATKPWAIALVIFFTFITSNAIKGVDILFIIGGITFIGMGS